MKDKNTVTAVKIYHPPGEKPHTDLGQQTPCPVEFVEGIYPGPVLKDLEIESCAVRRGLKSDEANICISVQPGEEKIGQLHFCVQHEGKKGLTDACMEGQNDLAGQVSQWLGELLEDAEEPWTFEIHAQPCPKADAPFRILEITRKIQGESAHQHGRQADVEPTLTEQREHGYRNG